MRKRTLILGGSAGVFLIAGLVMWRTLISFTEDLPSTSSLLQYRPSLVTKVYDINGQLIDELFMERRTLVPLRDIPVDLQNAVLAIEDTSFFHHWGLDPTGIIRAFTRNIGAGQVVQGGSTITQQLAKVMFLSPERKLSRKIQELLLALHIEREFSKEEILQFYLNQIYFGAGAYGVQAAARLYFNKPVEDLSLAECAMLAGLPRAPNANSPARNLPRAYRRRSVVLRRMRTLGFITEEERVKAESTRLPFVTYAEQAKPGAYFVEHIRKRLLPEYGENKLYKSGLSIYTTLDLEMQKQAEQTMEARLKLFDEMKKEEAITKIMEEAAEEGEIIPRDEVVLSTSDYQEVQGAIISIDPRNGQIRAMVGGRDFNKSEFNRAAQARRQPGSGFKSFIYAAAIDNGYTPATILKDEPKVYFNDGVNWALLEGATTLAELSIDFSLLEGEEFDEMRGKIWNPRNYYDQYAGDITLRDSLIMSINCSTVDLIDRIRPVTAAYYARMMGITSQLPQTLSLALGSSEVTPLEIASAYCVFANQGIMTEPYDIIRIEDYEGNTVKENFPRETQVLSPQTNYIMVNLLQQACEYGTGRATRRLRRPLGGKTGTTNNFSDAWFTGFTPNLVTSVWVGYDNRVPLGRRQSGGVVAAPIWTDFMQKALAHTPILDFPVPGGIVFVNFDPKTGMLASEFSENAVIQPFIRGTEPKRYF